MGLTWRSEADTVPPAPPTADTFAEVIYGRDEILVINLEAALARDRQVADAMMDVIATTERRESAEWALTSLAGSLGLAVHPRHVRGHHQLTFTTARPTETTPGA